MTKQDKISRWELAIYRMESILRGVGLSKVKGEIDEETFHNVYEELRKITDNTRKMLEDLKAE